MPTVARINTTPIKGTALHHPSEVEVSPTGIVGDRRFYLVDPSGELCTAFAHGSLVRVRTEHDARRERLRVTLPDGRSIEGSAEADGEAVVTDFYGRPVPGRSVRGAVSDALAAYVGGGVRLVRADLPNGGVDEEPVTMVSQASVEALASHGRHEGPLDPRRFRMSFELAGAEPFEEDTWDGHRVAIGEAVVRVAGQVPRCRVTNQDPLTGDRDWNTLTQIARYRPRIPGDGGLPFGVYADVVTPGRVRVGDVVEPIRPDPSNGGSP